jgi:hypothetical protein
VNGSPIKRRTEDKNTLPIGRIEGSKTTEAHTLLIRCFINDIGPILLKKSFGGAERNFLGSLMRFMLGNVRDHITSQQNNHGAS